MNNHLLSGLLLLLTLVWGWTFTVVKDAVAGYGVVSFLAVRFVIGAVCLVAIGWRRVTRQSIVVGGIVGVVLAAGYLFQTFGLRHTTATNSGLITSLFVVFAPLANRVLFGIRTSWLLWGAICVSLLGLVLLTGAGPVPLSRGDWLTLGAAVGFGTQIAILDRYSRDHDTLGLAVTQVASAAVVLLAAWPFAEPFLWPSNQVWSALLLTGVVATAMGFYVQTLAQRQLPAARVAVIFTLESVFAMLFGHLLAGDRLTGIQWLGAVLMISAVGMAEIIPAVARERRLAIQRSVRE